MQKSKKAPPAPAPSRVLTAGVDIARDRLEIEITAWGKDGARWPLGMMTREAPNPADRQQRGSPPDARGTRSATFNASSYDPATRTVEAVFSAGSRVRRWFGFEELAIDAGAIDLTRVQRNLCPLLNSHNQWDIGATLGTIESARIENGQLVGRIRFADTEQGRQAEGMVSRGELTGISIGYLVRTWRLAEILENEDEVWRAESWELLEVSLVSVPADPNAGVRSISGANPGAPATTTTTTEDDDMLTRDLGGGNAPTPTPAPAPITETRTEPTPAPTPAPAPAPEQRQQPVAVTGADVRTAATNAGLDTDATLDLLERHATTPFTRDALLADIGRRFAERDSGASTTNRITVTRDAGDTMLRGMGDALSHRFSPGTELTDVGRQFRGMGLLRMAEELLVARGVSVRGLSSHEIAERSLHSTSDFPALVGGALNRRLRASYEENTPTYRIWARRAPNAPDFKTIDVVQMSAMPDLSPVGEGGEFKYGTASDGKVSYKMATYGKIIGFTRQMIINDDLRALDRVISGFAGSAARLENRIIYGLLAANANMPDGTPLFHADHGNLAGAGAHIDGTSLKGGRGRLRLQKGLQKEELNIAPRFLLAPTTEEQAAYNWTSANYVPAKSTDQNEFRAGGRTAVEPIIDAVLDSLTGTSWFMVADHNQCDTVEYCYLDGAEGVQMSSRMGFTVDGVEFKASLDFAGAVIDHRGMDKNPGSNA